MKNERKKERKKEKKIKNYDLVHTYREYIRVSARELGVRSLPVFAPKNQPTTTLLTVVAADTTPYFALIASLIRLDT